jgi:ferredoxin
VICEPCIGVKDASCVEVCPVDCIRSTDDAQQYFIDPDVCIDCGACEPVCPVSAIRADTDVPDEWKQYMLINADFFKASAGAAPGMLASAQSALHWATGGQKARDAGSLRGGNVDGEYYAIDGTCTHRGGPLAEGELAGAVLTCPWHLGQFDVRTGGLARSWGHRRTRTCRSIR